MLEAPLRGIVTPLVTPIVRGALDSGGLERMIEHVITGGVNGIFVLGTTGEGPSLSYAFREEMIRQACKLVNARVPVLACVSDTALVESERMVDIAAEAGANAVVLAPPYYFQYSQSDLVRYIEVAAFRFSLPLFLYNIPQLTKVAFEADTVCRAARIPGILGLKDSSCDLTYLSRVIEGVKDCPEFSVLTGPEEILLDAMRAGSHGGICGGSNLSPMLFHRLYLAASTSKWDEAAVHQARVLAISKALYNTGFSGTSYLTRIEVCSGTDRAVPRGIRPTADQVHLLGVQGDLQGLLCTQCVVIRQIFLGVSQNLDDRAALPKQGRFKVVSLLH